MTAKKYWILGAVFSVVFIVATTGLVLANNQWSCWHWNKANIKTSTAVGGHWGSIINGEFSQWASGTCISFSGGSEIIGDADFYGNTGWLGIARILEAGPGCTIVAADMLMNRSYMDASAYDDTDDEHVTCQELGHTIGLDHRKRQDQTCMNDRVLGYPDFDQHDADVVNAITDDSACSDGGNGDPCANNGEKGRRKCNDGLDNDGDGCVDGNDPDCQ